MIRPMRASLARKLVRSPGPRRPLHWSIEERDTDLADHNIPAAVHEWCCLRCESGTGTAPTHSLAEEAAATHWRAAHSAEVARP